jgi:hypothetical protein
MVENTLMCWNNWKQTLVNDLQNNGHEFDMAFITYNSIIIKNIKDIIKPKYMELMDKTTQRNNFYEVVKFINLHKNEYDRFVIMRCDFRYRIPITKWPKWNENGIILTNKDVHWPSQKYYSDVLFIFDNNVIEKILEIENREEKNAHFIHDLGKFLYEKNIPFHLMYEDYYYMNDHPLHAMASLEIDEPDLENPQLGMKIKDNSHWN